MLSDPERKGLTAAASWLAEVMREVAAVRTKRTADAVNVHWNGDEVQVRAGRPEGKYGWEPITALMFDDNLRHELFGNDQHWYHQGHYPIVGLTLELGLDMAVEDFADEAVPALLDEVGL